LIRSKALKHVDEVSTVERITADADHSALPKTHFSCLVDSFIGESARA
jgi:hypothetical protein